MRNLKFKKIWLLSRKETKARIEDLSSTQTAILGANGTGKSSLIKSIYYAFGADAAKVHSKWKDIGVETRLDFSVDDVPYSIVRCGSNFGLFNAQQELVWTAASIVADLGPKLAKLLDFQLQLTNKNSGEVVVPPPSFCFLPFYFDQDVSWHSTWSSFASLAMMKDYKKEAAYYHSGMRPNEYYLAKSTKLDADVKIGQLRVERNALDKASERFRSKRTNVAFNVDVQDFDESIQRLIVECQSIREVQDDVKRNLADIYSERALISEQIKISKSALSELDKDYVYSRDLSSDRIPCPTCGTYHENDFVARYSLMSDADSCREFIRSGESKMLGFDRQIEKERAVLDKYAEQIYKIDSILDEQRGAVKLRDVIAGAGEKLIENTFAEEFQELDGQIGSLVHSADEAFKKMKGFESREKQTEIRAFYLKKMNKFLRDLDVPLLVEKDYKKIEGTLNTTGSELPRALLAYYYAFLHTMHEFSSSPRCPIVIDSPLQQDQDDENIPRILKFAIDNVPDGQQLILGSVQLHGVPFNGAVIHTTTKGGLLGDNAYKECLNDMDPLVDKIFAS
jgi:hypothetical protein